KPQHLATSVSAHHARSEYLRVRAAADSAGTPSPRPHSKQRHISEEVYFVRVRWSCHRTDSLSAGPAIQIFSPGYAKSHPPSVKRKMFGAALLAANAWSARSRSIGARFSVSITLTRTSNDRRPKCFWQASGKVASAE